MAKVNFIRNYARKNLMKATDEGIMVIPNTQKVDFQEAMLKQLLIENGINPNAIKSDGAMNEAMAFINQSQKTNPPSTEAKVFDLKGDRLDPRQNIMGGTQEESIKKNIAAATKKGDFTGIANQALRDPDIAREFMLSKKFPFRREENVRSGADAIPLARKAEFDEEMKMKDMAKERDYSVEQLVSDFKKFGNATDKDIQTIMKSGKMGQIPYVMDNYGMSYTEVLDTLKRGKPLIEGMAQGGRIGLKDGMDRRTFMKIMGGLATLPIIGKFLKPAKTAKVAKDVSKVVPSTQPPSYFFSLAEKIKLLGKESKVKPQERVNEYYYTGKNGDEYTLTEDISTGDMQIVKDKTGVGVSGEKSFDVINDRTVMDYKKGKGDETTKGTPADEYDEYKVEFDQDGTMAGADDISEITKKEIVDEVSDNIPSIKKASGGIARMLGE